MRIGPSMEPLFFGKGEDAACSTLNKQPQNSSQFYSLNIFSLEILKKFK
jgi:hypothetical protein